MSTSDVPPSSGQGVSVAGYQDGDRVTVIDGTFVGSTGTVAGLDRWCARYRIVRVLLPIFGKDTRVELLPFQIKHDQLPFSS
jgi:transcription antitermination factor NusG